MIEGLIERIKLYVRDQDKIHSITISKKGRSSVKEYYIMRVDEAKGYLLVEEKLSRLYGNNNYEKLSLKNISNIE